MFGQPAGAGGLRVVAMDQRRLRLFLRRLDGMGNRKWIRSSTPGSRRCWLGMPGLPPGADAKREARPVRKAAAMAGGERGEAIVPGKPEESLLWEKVDGRDAAEEAACREAEKAALKDWIAGGAHWGTDPIDPFRSRPPGGPAATGGRCSRSGGRASGGRRRGLGRNADRLASSCAPLEAKGLSPSPEADRADADPPPDLRPDRPAARRRRRSTRSSPTVPRTPTRGWSIGCWRRRTTASAGRGTGSTWSASARATASSDEFRPTPGAIATG